MLNSSDVISVQGICKTFNGKLAVSNLNLTVKRGEIFGFLGPNGSGKTTTIRMLCGLLTPDSGQGTCLGYNIITQSGEIKKQIGYMTQKFSLYEDLSVYENLDFIARIYGIANRAEKIQQVLDKLQFTSSRRKQLAVELSGGFKQRLSLASALLHQPKLLLLDEPTAGVDPKARREFWDEIHELASQGITVLVSTHYMDEAERCHRLGYIMDGELLVTGTITDIIKNAKLTTWTVSGKDLSALAMQLRELPAIEQVVAFGQVLHVTGRNAEAMTLAIKPFQGLGHHWQPANANLEDVFIHLAAKKTKEHQL